MEIDASGRRPDLLTGDTPAVSYRTAYVGRIGEADSSTTANTSVPSDVSIGAD